MTNQFDLKSVDVWDIAESLNENAHSAAWHSWETACEAEDETIAEQLREEASKEQAEYFRDDFFCLNAESQESIRRWLKVDTDLKEQFRDWYGHEQFDEEFGDN